MSIKQPFILVVLDGWGFSNEKAGNPFSSVSLPVYDMLRSTYPSTLLQASGQTVGLNWGEPGNSEVGHLTLGSGRIVLHYSTRIDNAIGDGSLAQNEVFSKMPLSRVHLVGLLTSGKVHSSFQHLTSLVEILNSKGASSIYLHLFTDGKDSGLKEAPSLIKKLLEFLMDLPAGEAGKPNVKIATLIGRNIAMNRNRNWSDTQKAFELITQGNGNQSSDLIETLDGFYGQGITDSDIPPIINSEALEGMVKDNDSVFFFNFREDSIRQLAHAFSPMDFSFFDRKLPPNLFIATMTKYLDDKPLHVLVPPPDIQDTLPGLLAQQSKTQLHIGESEKYAHVTYFFNGLRNEPFDGETDIFIDSLEDIEHHPEMRAKEITDRVIQELNRDFYDFILINYANADLLAHTGNFDAAVKGLKVLDGCLKTLHEAARAKGGVIMITADHGNVESLTYKGSGEKESRHNDNPVPFILVSSAYENKRELPTQTGKSEKISGILTDVAPTILELMGMQKPNEMTGQSLLSILGQ